MNAHGREAKEARDGPKARILAAALTELRRHGQRRFTVVAVAEAAGMTHANVYRFFTSKVDLLDALNAGWMTELERQMTVIADGPDPATDKLERMVFLLSRIYREVRASDPELFGVFVDAHERTRVSAKRHRQRLRRLFERVMDEGITTGVLGTRDRARAMTLLFDATYRFVQPSALAQPDDGGGALELRLERVLTAAMTALQRGR